MRTEPKEITDLRRQAKALSKATGEQHTKCLREIARRKGYTTWENLLRDKLK